MINDVEFRTNFRIIAVLTLGCLLGGCGGLPEGSDETASDEGPVDSLEQDWSVASCATVPAHQTFTGGIAYTTSDSYNRCDRSAVFDINDVTGSISHGVAVGWTDTLPSSVAACSRASSSDSGFAWGGAILYKKNASGAWVWQETRESYGHWKSTGSCIRVDGGTFAAPCCQVPRVDLSLSPGGDYRIASSFRQYSAGVGTTKKHTLGSNGIE